MDGRDLVRSMQAVRRAGPARGLRMVRATWRRHRADGAGLPDRGPERARVPGEVTRVEPGPGGGVVHFDRSELRITVTVGGALFWGWEGAGPLPSYALAGGAPEPDPRASLEPDTAGGWRVVAERVTVAVSRHGAMDVYTPGGVRLRHDQPPRWWEPVGGGQARWVQRSRVAADARFFGLGGRSGGPRLRDGTYRLWNADPQAPYGPQDDPLHITMPVQFVVADAGTHLVFHDTTWDGAVTLREGAEGAGSGHDRAGASELRMEGGPLRCWVAVGSPARVLRTWAALTGTATPPPAWAFGHHHVAPGPGGEAEVRRVVARHRAHRLPLDAVHVDVEQAADAGRPAVAEGPGESLPRLAKELREDGVRLVGALSPAVPADRDDAVFASGRSAGVFVADAAGRPVRGEGRHGESVYPDFTDPQVRSWWGERYRERLDQGFAGFWHTLDEPVAYAAYGDATLPRSARHALEGQGGDHRAAHNVYGLTMARAAHEALAGVRPGERPLLLARSGWAGMQRYAGAWCGTVAAGWPGLRAALSVVLGLGLCGVPFAGPDLVDGGAAGSPELQVRRLQLAVYLPLLRTRAPDRPEGENALESEVLAQARPLLAERRRLNPYFVTLAQLARRTGAPPVRPLWWGSPEIRALRDCEDAFLLGDAFLVAPVLVPGVDRRDVRLPPGRWYDTRTGRSYDGPARVVLPAPLDQVPVLARAGSVVPVLGEDGRVELEAWAPAPGRRGGGVLIPDAGHFGDMADAGGAGGGPRVERYVSRRSGDRLTVERHTADGPREAGRPVRARGL